MKTFLGLNNLTSQYGELVKLLEFRNENYSLSIIDREDGDICYKPYASRSLRSARVIGMLHPVQTQFSAIRGL